MSIGPIQLLVLGFDKPNFHGEVMDEINRLRESDIVRVIDAVVVFKDARGQAHVTHENNLSQEEAISIGKVVGALVGLGRGGTEGRLRGAELGGEMAAQGVDFLSEGGVRAAIDDMPNDSATALILLEHHWAAPLRGALLRAGGFRISEDFISPLNLVELGLVSNEEANEYRRVEIATAFAAPGPRQIP